LFITVRSKTSDQGFACFITPAEASLILLTTPLRAEDAAPGKAAGEDVADVGEVGAADAEDIGGYIVIGEDDRAGMKLLSHPSHSDGPHAEGLKSRQMHVG
jgi:hypothetical protein